MTFGCTIRPITRTTGEFWVVIIFATTLVSIASIIASEDVYISSQPCQRTQALFVPVPLFIPLSKLDDARRRLRSSNVLLT